MRLPRAARRAAVVGLAISLLLAGCTATPEADESMDDSTPAPIVSATVVPEPTEPVAAPSSPPEPPAPEPTPPPLAPDPAPVVPPSTGVDAPGVPPRGGAIAIGDGPSPGADVDPELSKTHDDSVEVISEIGALSFAYTEAYGDDFSFVDSGWDDSSTTLTLNVTGTHDGDDSVANWFNDQTLGYAVHTDIDTNDEPNELHYAFCGSLAFSQFDTQIETCFGQGDSDTLANNWWMGGQYYYVERPECYIDENTTDENATSLVACLESHGSSSYTFEVNSGGASPNLFSLYSPSQIGPLTGSRLEAFVAAHPDLSSADKAVLDTLARELKKADIEVPSSWKVSCGSTCTESITKGELWAGVHDTTTYESEVWKKVLSGTNLNNYSINVTAGRNSSSDVADWFIDAVGSGAMIGAGANDGTTQPGKLHFAFCGELTPQGGTATASAPLCIGQGENHDDGDANNWWIGGSDWKLATMGSSTAAEALGLFVPVDELGILPDTEVRMLFNPDTLTAIFVLSGNVATGAVLDGMAFVVGLG
ncbi:hypothetical protein M4I32_14910 [Microbacterium sp. LRZ72]|uniref:hypothetical protein n=1 Tax=Microbacterium sp. LRZ72 TaxID=2942481 RepID=UPI0029AC9222|nr:hypothetical protein [Microbacterium sp. LRZ72]MDX2378081.1 hypothetical protein [Microbacterium sp. LRZ72]